MARQTGESSAPLFDEEAGVTRSEGPEAPLRPTRAVPQQQSFLLSEPLAAMATEQEAGDSRDAVAERMPVPEPVDDADDAGDGDGGPGSDSALSSADSRRLLGWLSAAEPAGDSAVEGAPSEVLEDDAHQTSVSVRRMTPASRARAASMVRELRQAALELIRLVDRESEGRLVGDSEGA